MGEGRLDAGLRRERCDFACEEQMCLTLDKAGVPRDNRWRSLILYIRSLEFHDYLTQSQKQRFQQMLVGLLRDGDYSDARYGELMHGSEEILSAPYLEKIQDAVDESERLEAIRESFRILKPGGIMFAAAISRFASLMDGSAEGFLKDPEFRQIVAADLTSGQHRNPTSNPAYFTTSYFHRPEELEKEVAAAGYQNVRVLAVEGPVWSAARFKKVWEDETQRKTLMEFLAMVEQEPSIRGASAHLLAVANRPKLEGRG